MKIYRAHYTSPHDDNPVNGTFEFSSEGKVNSRQNMRDARIRMLEIFGNDALSWVIDHVEVAKKSESTEDASMVQMQLDFREPKKIRHRKIFERGKVGGK